MRPNPIPCAAAGVAFLHPAIELNDKPNSGQKGNLFYREHHR
jgi:hypothetical protein